ncbi:membrane-spanning 4-domains subfamily A member 4D-like isoform X1 [Hyperolius riggenbachi]|uniref:membrane-spanning 4-domains subfamily A member 4D-like isoform X1 n=1 Tax=Hyperolius riggenbachi TaxID=752182 RepID=UPI0035A2F521
MSLTPGEVNANNYKTTICENPQTTIPTPAVPLAMYRHDVNPSPPAYQGPSATQTWNVPTVAPQWIVATLVSPNVDSSAPFFQTFLKGKPKALGIVVIVAAIIEVGLGIALACIASSITVISGIPFWGAIFYIIAGSLTIAAQKKPNICLVRGSLSLNIISTIFTTVAIILNAFDFPMVDYNSYSDSSYSGGNNYYYNASNNYYYNGYGNQQSYYNGGGWHMEYYQPTGGFVILSLLVITNVLLFCVTFSTSIFGCRSLCKEQPQVTQIFLIQNDAVIPMTTGAAPAYCVQMPPPPPLYPVNDVKAT